MPLAALRSSIAPLLAVVAAATAASASETAERFLERLRETGHDDLVTAYLERAADDPLASAAFKERAQIELIDQRITRAVREPAAERRATAFDAIERELSSAAPASPEAKRAATDARGALALALADDARRLALTAVRSSDDKQLTAARRAIASARERLDAVEREFVAEREALKGVKPESDAGRRNRDVGARLGQARLVAARLIHELAMTHPANSKQRERLNRDAAGRLAELYEKYSRWIVGLYAHLYEGRCYRLLGEDQLALGCFEDLTSQSNTNDELRQLITLAHAEIAALRVNSGRPAEALEEPRRWHKGLSRADRRSPQGATLGYWVGRAALEQSSGARDADKKRLLKQAKELLAESARTPTEVQPEARAAWARVNTLLGADAARPETFEDAYQAGKEALAALGAARLASDNGSDERVATSRAAAREAFRAALELAGRRVDEAKLNETRYLLAWLLWEEGDDVDAARLAGSVARRSPQDPVAESSAQLALAAMQRVQRNNTDARLAAAAGERLTEFATYTAETWPDSEAAGAALQVLLSAALNAGDLDAARRVLDGVNDARRPALALQFALARYERASRERPSNLNAEAAPLRDAYDAAREVKPPRRLLATATLYLAQAALTESNAADALALLNAPEHGAAEFASASDAGAPFQQQTLIALSRAVGGADARDRVDATLATLDRTASELDADRRRRLVLTLGSRLRTDLKASVAAGRSTPAALTRLSSEVLRRIGDAVEEPDWNTALWMAQTRLELSDALGDNPAAREQLEAASGAFTDLVRRADAAPGFAPSATATLAARLQLAECDRRLGKQREALEAFRQLLAERPAMLEVQVAAAETLQAWGAESGAVERIEASIVGDYPDAKGKNTVWGWAKIAQVAGRALATNPKLEPTFYRAWLNVAKSRYLAGSLQTGTDRDEQFRKAATTIKALRRQHPDLGGGETAAEFASLLRRVDKSAGQGS